MITIDKNNMKEERRRKKNLIKGKENEIQYIDISVISIHIHRGIIQAKLGTAKSVT